MSIDATALPSELLVAPQPLIGFCGLDVLKNSVHKSIWDAFNSNRKPDRPAVQFKLLPPNYEFPVAKPKRASYEWYHPKGILKRNWMLKHLHVLPSVVVLFQDMEWNDPLWTDKQLQCASTIQSLKNSLQERNTRLALVLLQKAAPLPPGEDMLASERAASLTNACGISSKMLFILPHTDHLVGYTSRLESALLEMAQGYYTLMSKRIRTHRDQLTSSHHVLKIRHQFKLGFVSEMRQDYSTALKHYSQAFANLEEIRVVDTNCLEIKTIAGFLNYKICRLMFKLKVPRDSINHFISHIEKYKNRIGFKDLLFEHYAWLSTQHSAFADLFCEAIKNGLPALQTQHPGMYYYKAASNIVKRKEAFLQCCALSLSPTEPTTPTTLQNISSMALFSEYFGIRTIKTGEPVSEQQVIMLVQENEKNFNHSSAIIQLLGQAMAQFKVYKGLRFRKKLAVDMAEEYFKCGDHAKALTLYSLMLPDYRQDKWSLLFSDVLLKTLRSAFLSASVADYVACSFEALSLKNRCDQKERIQVLENLWKVFQNVPPVSQSQIAPELRTLWENSLANFKSPAIIDLDKITELLECNVSFDKSELKNDEMINIRLVVRLLTDVPLKIHSFTVVLIDNQSQQYKLKAIKYTIFQDLSELRNRDNATNEPKLFDGDLKLEPEKYYEILFCTEAQQYLENTQLQVSCIEALIGTEKIAAILVKNATLTKRNFKHHNRYRDLIDNVTTNPTCYIVPTFHLVTQTTQPVQPMLVNEFFSIVCVVNNPFNVFLQNVGISISVPNNLRNNVFLTTDISSSRQKLHSQIQIDIGELSMLNSTSVSYYVFSLIETNIELQQKVWYNLDSIKPKPPPPVESPSTTDNSPINSRVVVADFSTLALSSLIRIDYIDDSRLSKARDEIVSISCESEFKFCGRFYTLNRQPLTKIYRGENFLFRANIEVQAKCDLDILETYFICDHNLVQSTYSFKRKKYINCYRSNDTLEDVIVLRTNSTNCDWITAKQFEHNENEPEEQFHRSRTLRRLQLTASGGGSGGKLDNSIVPSSAMNKNLLSKIPNNMTIIGNCALLASQTSILSTSTISDDGKLKVDSDSSKEDQPQPIKPSSRMVYSKAIEAITPTGKCRGFIKGVLTNDSNAAATTAPIFGVYCIKWRRNGCKDENESKFVVTGLDIDEPPLNIYCSIEEKMFVKVPMTLKVVLKNPTAKVVHLISTLSVSNSDNFMCSGHKQLDVSIFAYSEKELVFNLYPLKVGWQNLPELNLEYNTLTDPSRDESQNQLLNHLVQRSMPKKVFVLPPYKQHSNGVK
ncbi:trafficking protein particle complex subunit 11 [Episyrphus balteatus]|uniref:trafficking protein particle complex subunit 11 n=1 Tax=Episyrphus balteatus TaxID=286459 RepID=UPI0024853D39|nr:trafficking protein particle complex subunit 11 [Episyrphus balteatus]